MAYYTIVHKKEIKEWDFSKEDMENDPELYRVVDGYCNKYNKTIFYESKNQAIHDAIFNLKMDYDTLIRKLENQRI